MSGCGSGCSCGSNCSCGSGCKCGKRNADIEISATAAVIIDGVAPKQMYGDGSESGFVAEGGNGCKCGANCKCTDCNC